MPNLPLNEHQICVYDRFDPRTLTPLNAETEVRVRELADIVQQVQGRTVLDIGCNSGLTTLLAAKAGALHVLAVAVNHTLVEGLNSLAQDHGVAIEAVHCNFWDIPEEQECEVVFAFEVIHWLVQQGARHDDIASRLRRMTLGKLFVETPWDSTEPSIAHGTSGSEVEAYSARDLIRALIAVGFSVSVLHFSQYFAGASCRVMLEASVERPVASESIALHFNRISPTSLLLADRDWGETILSHIARQDDGPFLGLVRGSRGFLAQRDQECGYLTPFLEEAKGLWEAFEDERVFDSLLDTALEASLALWEVGSQDPSWEVNNDNRSLVEDGLCELLLGQEAVGELITPEGRNAAARILGAYSRSPEPCDSVAHGDLHPSNVLVTEAGTRVIDLENLRPAPAFVDLLRIAPWMSGRTEMWWARVREMENAIGRRIEERDLAVAIAILLRHAAISDELPAEASLNGINWILAEVVPHVLGQAVESR